MIRRTLSSIIGVLLTPVRRLSLRIARATAPRQTIAGIEVVDLIALETEGDHTQGIREAVQLVASVSPPHLTRLQKELSCILVGLGKGFFFEPSLKACGVGEGYQEGRPVELLAAYLVHEATHASLWRRGFRYHPHLRARIERACIRAEMRFARNLPDPSLVIVQAQKRMLAKTWRTEKEMFDHREEEYIRLGVPKWLLRIRRILLAPRS